MPRIRMLSGTIKDVSERDAKILIAIKKAELVQDEPINDDAASDDQPKRKYRTKTMKAD